MSDRLRGKTAIVVGAGQTPGSTIGNGRATAILFARQGARICCADRDLASAEETVAMIAKDGGEAFAHRCEVTSEEDCRGLIAAATAKLGRIDILHNNVGIGGGDGPAHRLEKSAFERILAVNLEGMWLTIKHALPVMRDQPSGGAIVNISSLAAIAPANILAYEVSKAGVNKLTTSVAAANARHMIRCNAIMPGLMDTPMAIEGIARARGESVEAVREARNKRVPLGAMMGTAWDVAFAALFLASDEAKFITGVILPVDGGMGVRLG
ncbi:MAG: SDR family NAD(P)-dependent oxidoreductase [Caulobacteraceae bacterium]